MEKVRLYRLLVIAVVAVPALAYLAFEGSYRAVLASIPGRPSLGAKILPAQVSRALWSGLEEGPIEMQRGEVWRWVFGRSWRGSDVAYAVAKEYLRRDRVVEQWRARHATAISVRWKMAVAGVMTWVSRNMTAEQALGYWASEAPFGAGINGVDAAAREYFGKVTSDLTTDEAATLAAIAQSPRYRPDCFPEAGKTARDVILSRMARAGLLSGETAEELMRSPTSVKSGGKDCR